MTAEYPYAHQSLLDQPNTYAYTRYSGEAFLGAWRRSRRVVLDDLPLPTSGVGSSSGNADDSLAYLDAVCERLSENREDAATDLDPMVRSFEVHKRIYRQYTERWRPRDRTDFRDLAPYLRFAEALDLAYEIAGGLPYLNALLKVLDILTVLHDRLPSDSGGRLARLIVRESQHVEALDAKVGAGT